MLEEFEAHASDRVLDGTDDALSTDDMEPGAQTEDSQRLQALMASAAALAASNAELERRNTSIRCGLKSSCTTAGVSVGEPLTKTARPGAARRL